MTQTAAGPQCQSFYIDESGERPDTAFAFTEVALTFTRKSSVWVVGSDRGVVSVHTRPVRVVVPRPGQRDCFTVGQSNSRRDMGDPGDCHFLQLGRRHPVRSTGSLEEMGIFLDHLGGMHRELRVL